jgi:hypothetical protein
MYFFLIFGLPLGFLLLVLYVYPLNERPATKKTFLRGLVAFIPIWIVARILGAIVPALYGSCLLAFHEWADRLLPYSVLPALAYLVFYKPDERLPLGMARRRFTSFYAGSLAPVGLFETLRIWGSPGPYQLFILPILLGSICMMMPKTAALVHDSYGSGLVASIAGTCAVTLVVSLCPFLFLVGLWPLALLLVAAVGAGAWVIAFPEIERRPPLQSMD